VRCVPSRSHTSLALSDVRLNPIETRRIDAGQFAGGNVRTRSGAAGPTATAGAASCTLTASASVASTTAASASVASTTAASASVASSTTDAQPLKRAVAGSHCITLGGAELCSIGGAVAGSHCITLWGAVAGTHHSVVAIALAGSHGHEGHMRRAQLPHQRAAATA
jgi:hypothetical protein